MTHNLPHKGEKLQIVSVVGNSATIRKCRSGRDWVMVCDDPTKNRARFGNAVEIKEDIEHFQSVGNLPESKGHLVY